MKRPLTSKGAPTNVTGENQPSTLFQRLNLLMNDAGVNGVSHQVRHLGADAGDRLQGRERGISFSRPDAAVLMPSPTNYLDTLEAVVLPVEQLDLGRG